MKYKKIHKKITEFRMNTCEGCIGCDEVGPVVTDSCFGIINVEDKTEHDDE